MKAKHANLTNLVKTGSLGFSYIFYENEKKKSNIYNIILQLTECEAGFRSLH